MTDKMHGEDGGRLSGRGEDTTIITRRALLGAGAAALIAPACSFHSAASGNSSAAPPIDGRSAAEALALAVSRRIDVLMIADSNQLHGGNGWNDGWQYALWNKYGLYATSMSPSNDNQGQGSGLGFYSAQGPGSMAYSSAGGAAEQYCPDGTLPPWNYAYQPGGTNCASNQFLVVIAGGPWDLNHNLRAHFATLTFADGAGLFQPNCRLEVPPYSPLVQSPAPVDTNDGVGGRIAFTSLDVPANSVGAAAQIGFRAGFNGATPLGPFVQFYSRMEDPNVMAGGSGHTIYGVGGKGMYDYAAALIGSPDLELWMIFAEARRLQTMAGFEPVVVVIVNGGLNDRNYTAAELPTLGPGRLTSSETSGNSSAAYIDNFSGLVDRIEGLYAQFWPLSELSWLIMPSHQVSDPDDPLLVDYRAAAKAWSEGFPRSSFVDLSSLATYAEMLSWYDPTGTAHLLKTGYETLATRALASLTA